MNPRDDIPRNRNPLGYREILVEERREHEAKTARLREARLAKEKPLEPPPAAKPRRKPRGWP